MTWHSDMARGYSLLELLVVLAIMALIVAAAAPAIGGAVERMTLRSDVRTLSSELRRLREQALDRQADIALTVSGLAGNELTASDGSTIALAPGTRLQILSTGNKRVIIAWDGSISGAVRVARGRTSADIIAEPLTGRLISRGVP